MKKMNRRQGEALARKIAKLFGEDANAEYGPKVNENWFGPDRLIVGWEGGPFEWTYADLQDLAPKGWYVEAVNHWAVALYPI